MARSGGWEEPDGPRGGFSGGYISREPRPGPGGFGGGPGPGGLPPHLAGGSPAIDPLLAAVAQVTLVKHKASERIGLAAEACSC